MSDVRDYLKQLGRRGTDAVTGFRGVVTSVSFDLPGCVQFYVSGSTGNDGKIGDGYWFDAKRIKLSGKPVIDQPDFARVPGAVTKAPKS